MHARTSLGRGAAGALWLAGLVGAAPATMPTPAASQPAPATQTHPAEADEAIRVYARGDYAGTVRLLEPGFRAERANIQQRLLLARAYLHLERTAPAETVLRSVLGSDRENPEANRLLGRLLHQLGQHAEALPYLEHAYRLKDEPATASLLGQCHFALGDPAQAKVFLEKALAEDVRDPVNSFVLGRLCLDRGLGALAERYLLASRDAGNTDPELHRLLGRAYLLQRKYVGPIQVRRIPDSPKPGTIVDDQVVLGRLEGSADRYQVCTRYSALYEGYQVVAQTPNDAEGLYMLAAGWAAVGHVDEARAYLDRLADREPGSARALTLRARLAIQAGDFQGLQDCLAAGRGNGTFDAATVADFAYRAGVALRAAGKRDEAVAMLETARAQAPTAGRVLRCLANLYAATDQPDRARRTYARLVELFPDAPDIDALRNALAVLSETEEKGGVQ